MLNAEYANPNIKCLLFPLINSLQIKLRVFVGKKIDWFYTAHQGLMKVIILRKGVTISGLGS